MNRQEAIEKIVKDGLREEDLMAIDALERAEKYKWHDLRENPKDLPKKETQVLCCVNGDVDEQEYENSYVVMTYWECIKEWLYGNDRKFCGEVVAWKDFECFTRYCDE